ncbi:MAG: hypothetical protein C5B50_15515 [Verrucomicrobia bacterium]|nr:MAG: hypothetical protein C5B50_15515 [Verrucomicrobiota bacterium]
MKNTTSKHSFSVRFIAYPLAMLFLAVVGPRALGVGFVIPANPQLTSICYPFNATVSANVMFPNPDPPQDYSGPLDNCAIEIPIGGCSPTGYRIYYFDSVTTDTTTGFVDASGNQIPAPTLGPGQGFFFYNITGGAINVNVVGPVGGATPMSCPCGTFNTVGTVSGAAATYNSIVGSAPVSGSRVRVWNGANWNSEYDFNGCVWSSYINGVWNSPVAAPNIAVGTAVQVNVPCGNVPQGMKLFINGLSQIGVGHLKKYTLTVVNYGPAGSSPVYARLNGLPGSVTLTPPPGATLIGGGFVVNVPALACGQSATFPFSIKSSGPAGTSFTMYAKFLSTYAATTLKFVKVIASLDPNAKLGPSGLGTAHYVVGAPPTTVPYSISFENLATATAPAQRVVITDQLDPSRVSLGSLQLGPITFGDYVLTPPPGVDSYSVTVPYDVDGNPGTLGDDVNVQVTVGLDLNPGPTYGTITWTFQSLDPNTGLPPANPAIGFLPPNVTPPQGEGMVTFTVDSLPTLVNGNVIANSAKVVFDNNAPIQTGVWNNTILLSEPSLTIAPAPGGKVTLTWDSWTLVESATVDGTYAPSAVQVSPWTFVPGGTAKFYRLLPP